MTPPDEPRGAEPAAGFYADLVRPLLGGLPHAAARLGSGSDVLGLDDAMSRDHDWGCRLTLLLDDEAAVAGVRAMLERELPDGRRRAATRPGRASSPPGSPRTCSGSRSSCPAGGPPYAKWRGIAFRELPIARDLGPALAAAVAAPTWRDREDALAAAAESLLDLQRRRGLPAPPGAVVPFWDRPYRTIDGAVSRPGSWPMSAIPRSPRCPPTSARSSSGSTTRTSSWTRPGGRPSGPRTAASSAPAAVDRFVARGPPPAGGRGAVLARHRTGRRTAARDAPHRGFAKDPHGQMRYPFTGLR